MFILRFINDDDDLSVKEFVSLYLLVSNHRVQGSKQYMTISIEERNDANFVLFQEEVEMKQYIY